MMPIFIPEKCRVGFVERKDTFTGKLAYVIYYDAKGQIRKEPSWNKWRDEKIDPVDFENKPTSGFVLNKGIRRFNWSHFGTSRSMIRIYDPRGYEFEITPENLIGLLMHTDCSKREIQDDLVYAWCDGELMLLPCSSEEYVEAKNFSSLQGKSFSARNLVEGHTYVTKKNEKLVYLGRHMWYKSHCGYHDKKRGRVGQKEHVFCDLDGQNFTPMSVSSQIVAPVVESCHDQFANWLDAFLKTSQSSKFLRWEKQPIPQDKWAEMIAGMEKSWDRHMVGVEMDGRFFSAMIEKRQVKYGSQEYKPHYHLSYEMMADGSYDTARVSNGERIPSWRYDYSERVCFVPVTDPNIFFDLYGVFENGTRKKWSYGEW